MVKGADRVVHRAAGALGSLQGRQAHDVETQEPPSYPPLRQVPPIPWGTGQQTSAFTASGNMANGSLPGGTSSLRMALSPRRRTTLLSPERSHTSSGTIQHRHASATPIRTRRYRPSPRGIWRLHLAGQRRDHESIELFARLRDRSRRRGQSLACAPATSTHDHSQSCSAACDRGPSGDDEPKEKPASDADPKTANKTRRNGASLDSRISEHSPGYRAPYRALRTRSLTGAAPIITQAIRRIHDGSTPARPQWFPGRPSPYKSTRSSLAPAAFWMP